MMISRYIASLIFGAGVGGAATFFLFKRKGSTEDGTPGHVHHALKYGAPSSESLRFFENFVVCYDARLRNPRWVIEHIMRGRTRGEATRKNAEFYEDEQLDARFRARLADFKDSGYDRGHLAPAANHKASAETMLDTFALSNISPQVGRGFNRDYYARFERFVSLLTRSCDDVYIVTGPLYLPTRTPAGYMLQHPMIGQPPRMVAVPTHFFKVVLAERGGAPGNGATEAVLGAFVLPNAPLQPDAPLAAFSVPLEPLEEAAGLQFFPGFLNAERRAALDSAALAHQRWGLQKMALEGATAVPPLFQQGPQRQLLEATAESSVAESGAPVQAESEPMPPAAMRGATLVPPAAGEAHGRKPRKRRARVMDSVGTAGHTPGLLGVVHVCDFTKCELPAADWYLSSKNSRT